MASRWNDFITARLIEGALDAIARLGGNLDLVEVFKVPGAFEIPLMTKRCAESKRFDGVICVGVVLRGQTPHFDFVAGSATSGIAQTMLQTDVPIGYGIITADTHEQAFDRAGIKAGNKGFEAACVVIEMADLLKTASNQ